MLKEYGEKIPSEDKANIEREIENTRSAMSGGDPDQIKQPSEALTQASQKIYESMYKEAASQTQSGPGEGGTGYEGGESEGPTSQAHTEEGEKKHQEWISKVEI